MTAFLTLIAAVTAVIVLITKCIELRLALQKAKGVPPLKQQINDQLTPASPSLGSAERRTAKELAPLITKQWNKAGIFCLIGVFVFMMMQVYTIGPNVTETMQTIAGAVGVLVSVAYIFIAGIEARRAVMLHEEKGQAEILEAIPAAFKLWAEKEMEKIENEPNKAMETTPVAVTDAANAASAPATSVSHLGRSAKK